MTATFETIFGPEWSGDNRASVVLKYRPAWRDRALLFRVNYDNGNSFPQQMVCAVMTSDGTWKQVEHARSIGYEHSAKYYCKDADLYREDFDGYIEAWKQYIRAIYSVPV